MPNFWGLALLLAMGMLAGCNEAPAPVPSTRLNPPEFTGMGYIRTLDYVHGNVMHESDVGKMRQIHFCDRPLVWQGMRADLTISWDTWYSCYRLSEARRDYKELAAEKGKP